MPTPSPFADASAVPPAASGGTMDALYRAALGPVQLPRYLALFERFDRLGRAPAGWNLGASLATLNWMLLHHLWTAALIYVALVEGLALLIFGVGRPLLHWPEQVEWGLIAAFALFAIALPGLFGDALLHGEIRKRVARALVAAHSIPQACELLARQASSWRRLKWIALANVLLFAAITLAWVLVPPSGWSRAQPPAATMASGPVESATPALIAASQPAEKPLAPAEPTASSAASSEFLSPSPATRTDTASEPAVAASEPTASTLAVEAASAPEPDSKAQGAPATMAPPSTTPVAPPRSAGKQRVKPSATAPASNSEAVAAPATTASAPATPAKDATLSADNAAAAHPAAPLGKAPGYYLNVGVFAEEANARRAQAKLLNANLPAFRQTFDTKNGDRTRVRVGPFETSAEAQKAAAAIRSLQLDAVMYRQRG